MCLLLRTWRADRSASHAVDEVMYIPQKKKMAAFTPVYVAMESHLITKTTRMDIAPPPQNVPSPDVYLPMAAIESCQDACLEVS